MEFSISTGLAIFLSLFVVLLLWILVDNKRITSFQRGKIDRLNKMLQEEQKFREMREDSLAEEISEELSLPPGKRRLCHGCKFIEELYYLVMKFEEGVVKIPIYDEELYNKLKDIYRNKLLDIGISWK